MKHLNLALILMLLIAGSNYAQNINKSRSTSIDFSYGLLSIMGGDIYININQNFNLINNKLYSFGIHQGFTKKIGMKFSFDYGYYTAYNNNKLIFSSNVYGLLVKGEYNILTFGKNNFNSIYMFSGVGMAIISGKKLDGTTYESFNNTSPFNPIPFIPSGLGIKINVFRRISFGIEGDLHYFLSDKIDGFPKPNSYPHDMFSTLTINLKYHFFEKNYINEKKYKNNCRCE